MTIAADVVKRAYFVVFCCAGVFVVSDEQNAPNNFGTALYTRSDVVKRKWTDWEQIDLQCRMIVGPLVPTKTPEDGNVFLDYFDLIKNKAGMIHSAVGRKRRTMVMVVDAIGGYLYAEMLPRVRMLYYEGKLNYSTTKRLHDLMKNIKYVLDTDGRGWARPTTAEAADRNNVDKKATKTALEALVINGPPSKAVTEEAPRCGGVDAGPYGLPRRRQPRWPWQDEHADADVLDSLPFFDNDTRPHSLIVPWRAERPVLYGVRDAGCHRALFDHCARSAAAAATARVPSEVHATAADRYARDLSTWLHFTVRPLVTPVAAATRWYPGLWATLPVARQLHYEVGPRADDGDSPPAEPNVNFYVAAILATVTVFWMVCACVLFRSCWLRCLCTVCGHLMCGTRSADRSCSR